MCSNDVRGWLSIAITPITSDSILTFPQMSMRHHHGRTKSRPLPPLPLLFSSRVFGANVRLLQEGRGAEWCPSLALGVCGLDRPLRKGQEVMVEVRGTGYFSLLIRTTGPQDSLTQFVGRADGKNVVEELKFKLKKSKFLFKVEKTSRSHLHVLATSTGEQASSYDVTHPQGANTWVAFNVLFGNIRLTLLSNTGRSGSHTPWAFHNHHGLNIVKKSEQEVSSVRSNPCATIVTERPLAEGETMEISVQPQVMEGQSGLKILLTHRLPRQLKLQDPEAYFSDKKGLDRLLCEVYTLKKFKGTLALTLDTEAGSLEVEEHPHAEHKRSQPATHSISLDKVGLQVHQPFFVCLELLRTTVSIIQPRPSQDLAQDSQAGYALPVPAQAETALPACVAIPAANDYLTPVADTGFAESRAPQPHNLLTQFPPGSALPRCCASSLLSFSPAPSPPCASFTSRSTCPSLNWSDYDGKLDSPDGKRPSPREAFSKHQAHCDFSRAPVLWSESKLDLSSEESCKYLSMDGYVLPSKRTTQPTSSLSDERNLAGTFSELITKTGPPACRSAHCYLTPVASAEELSPYCTSLTTHACRQVGQLNITPGTRQDEQDGSLCDAENMMTNGEPFMLLQPSPRLKVPSRSRWSQDCSHARSDVSFIVHESLQQAACPNSLASNTSSSANTFIESAAESDGPGGSFACIQDSPMKVQSTYSVSMTSLLFQRLSSATLAEAKAAWLVQHSSCSRSRSADSKSTKAATQYSGINEKSGCNSSDFSRNSYGPREADFSPYPDIAFANQIVEDRGSSFFDENVADRRIRFERFEMRESDLRKGEIQLPLPLLQRNSGEISGCCTFPFRKKAGFSSKREVP